ncbi:MAG: hypothetical protein QOD72_2083, partial [Acidimicrobiaceae bacterium]|nr:hypothetical protein [Acidimicrobiaceae bacterium]
ETELGIEPSPELVALDAAILRQDPGLDFLPLSDVSAPRVGTPPSRPDIAPRRSKGRSDPVRPFTVVGKGRKDRAVRTSTASVDGNVPRALARIFGRDNEVSEVHSLLVESWLVSLIGTGGVGKTTLALAVAEAVAGSYPDGVWWLELASVRAGGDVIHMVASVLGVRENIGQSLLDTICEAVGQRRLLLVLDNCEHVVAEVAAIVATLGRRCSGLGVLTTSRERLGVPGERLVRVGPLAAETADDPAMELLLDRMDRPDVARDPIEAAALLDICQHLEGLPLALELAGARCISLRPSDVAARLKARVRLLSDSHRVEERQQTLEATVRWSFELLLEPEQVVFARLAVFVGGFTLDAAEAVCGDDGYDDAAVDDAVASLVDKSLVERDGRRYRMLETTRAFALEALDRQADTDRVQRRHVAFFVALVQRVRLGLRCGDESIWSEQLGADWPNVRAAFRRSVDHDDVEAATTVVANLSMEALFRRPEGLAWSKEAAERFGGHDGPLRHELLGAASFAEWALGNLERGIDLGLAAVAAHPAPATATDRLAETAACANLMWAGRLDESVEISTAAAADAHVKGETWNEMMFLTYLAYATGAQGAIDDALRSAQRAVVLADAMGSPTGRSWTSLVVARLLSDSKTALHLVDKALELARSVDNEWLEFQLILERARRLSRLGEPREALEHVTACAVQLQRQGRFLHAWRALIVAAEVHAKLGNNEVAAVLLGASRRSPAAAPHAADIDKIESTLTVASSGGGVADLAADGARLTLPEAIQRLVDATPTRS